jgi:hypothetical protein
MRRSFILATMLLTACEDRDGDGSSTPAPEAGDDAASADAMESSVEELAKAGTDVVSLATQGLRASVVQECAPTFGSCDLCYRLEGTPAAGEVTVVTDPPGCGETFTGTYGSAAYTVDSSELAGTWVENADGTYTVSLTGSREALLAVQGSGPRGTDFDVDASWTLDALEVTVTADLEIVSYHTVVTYEGLGSSAWTLEVSGDAASITGTVTMDAGSCTVTGTVEDVDVDCDAA